MYYHVLIEDDENQIVEHNYDLIIEEIEGFAKNYKLGQKIHFNGYILKPDMIRRLQFFETEDMLENILIKTNILKNYDLSLQELLRYSLDNKESLKDITSSVLSKIIIETKKIECTDSKKVFIVHGHDNELKNEVESFIKDLGLVPMILHKEASEGATIIEKIENHANESGFGIVLYSPCDKGGKDGESLKSRARQNVVFEHGFLIGRLGRNKTCAIIKGDIEKPNDISGLVYITHDIYEGWKIQLCKEIKKVFNDISFPI